MRFFILIVFMVSAFTFCAPSNAQEAASSPQNTEKSLDASTSEDDEDTIFSKATNEQIDEAQYFYKRCSKNETMSNKKDCKCAASAFLETRIRLGDDATTNQIMTENVNKCLKDEKRASVDKVSTDLSEVTDKQLDEAEMVFKKCKGDLLQSRSYDCECFAAKYLDTRIKLGPIVSDTEIINEFRFDCRNIVETTGYEYSRCMKTTRNSPVNNVEIKDFCECYARKWADVFESYTGAINRVSKRNMKSMARLYCQDPKVYP